MGVVSLCLPRAGARVVPLLRLQGGGRDPPRPRGGPPPFLPRSEWRPSDQDEKAAAKEDADALGVELACAEKVERERESARASERARKRAGERGDNHRTSAGAPQ